MVEPNVDPTTGPDDVPHGPDGRAPEPAPDASRDPRGAAGAEEEPTAPPPVDAAGRTAPADTDTEFARIVAGLDDVRAATEGVRAPAAPRLSDVPTLPGVRPLGPRDHRASQEELDLEDEQGRFVPPDPGPVLGGDPLLTTAWFAVVGGILALVVSAVFVRVVPSVVAWTGAGLLAAGAGVLLWRLPHERGDDERDDEPWV